MWRTDFFLLLVRRVLLERAVCIDVETRQCPDATLRPPGGPGGRRAAATHDVGSQREQKHGAGRH